MFRVRASVRTFNPKQLKEGNTSPHLAFPCFNLGLRKCFTPPPPPPSRFRNKLCKDECTLFWFWRAALTKGVGHGRQQEEGWLARLMGSGSKKGYVLSTIYYSSTEFESTLTVYWNGVGAAGMSFTWSCTDPVIWKFPILRGAVCRGKLYKCEWDTLLKVV